MKTAGELVRTIQRRHDLHAWQIAGLIGVSHASISYYLSGKRNAREPVLNALLELSRQNHPQVQARLADMRRGEDRPVSDTILRYTGLRM